MIVKHEFTTVSSKGTRLFESARKSEKLESWPYNFAPVAAIVVWLWLSLVSPVSASESDEISIIPTPAHFRQSEKNTNSEGESNIPNQTNWISIITPKSAELGRPAMSALQLPLKRITSCDTLISESAEVQEARIETLKCTIRLELDQSLQEEAYRVKTLSNQITIAAASQKGFARAAATILQIAGQIDLGDLPSIDIEDQPRCQYRSFMIDIGRNAHSLACLKETIDLLWYYKVDSLHLHLTDDQRFAFPSRKFPKVVTKSGQITWEEFVELDQYAAARGVTLIPELEVPGHSGLLIRTYPEIFGKNSTELASLESARNGIYQLLDEMIEVFSNTPFIHVGGDEAFGVPEEFQRDLINDLDDYLESKGRRTIVWEGPRLGQGSNKVHEDVLQINWRTINFPADEMLDSGYTVINAAWDPLYIVDHYPRNNFTMASPEYIYKNLDLLQFKHFNPDIATFADPIRVSPNDRLIGFCMPWWEGREENYFPLITNRLIPMAELAWKNNQERDFEKFSNAVSCSETIRQRAFCPVQIKPISTAGTSGSYENQFSFTLDSTEPGEIRFTTDGSIPTLQSNAMQSTHTITRPATGVVTAGLFKDGQMIGNASRQQFIITPPQNNENPNHALNAPVASSVTSGSPFGTQRLTDGDYSNLSYYLGYPAEPEPIEITIDLKETKQCGRVVVHEYISGSCYESYSVAVSNDGDDFVEVADRTNKPASLEMSFTEHKFDSIPARFVRITTNGCKGQVFDSFSRLVEIEVFAK